MKDNTGDLKFEQHLNKRGRDVGSCDKKDPHNVL